MRWVAAWRNWTQQMCRRWASYGRKRGWRLRSRCGRCWAGDRWNCGRGTGRSPRSRWTGARARRASKTYNSACASWDTCRERTRGGGDAMWIADGLNKLRLIPGGAAPDVAGDQGADTAVAADNSLLDKVRHQLAVQGARQASEAEILSAMEAVTGAASYENIPDTVRQLQDIQRELSGLGVLTEVLAEPGVTDVVVNPDGTVWADRGHGVERTPVHLAPPEVRELAVRLAAVCGVRLDDARPFADGIIDDLPPGIPAAALRVHAMLSPPARGGACVSLRTLTRGRLGLEDLCEAGMMPVEVRDKLRRLVLARKNLLVTGGTGTGKTTLLAALLGEVPEHERIVVVEDTPELMPTHPHVVALAAREGNADGAGEIGMRLLLRQCLRMRPDRIVVGEVRGAEVADLLVALNTGHAGSAGTMHANSVAAVPGRLAALGA